MPRPSHKRTPVKPDRAKALTALGVAAAALLGSVALVYVASASGLFAEKYDPAAGEVSVMPPKPTLDTLAYNLKLLSLAHVATSSPWYSYFLTGTTTGSTTPHGLWPVRAAYPEYGALLPFNRIVAYYGNFYSTQMGVLGEYPPEQVLSMLQSAVAQWQAADPATPVIPAIDYIAVTAQGSPGKDGKYRLRMPDDQIQKAIDMAAQVHGIVILDVQVGLSNVETEVPLLENYLKLPQVELALDPEFAMHNGVPPGVEIGSLDAADINFAAQYLARLVDENNLPPKILIVHRFTEDMVTNYRRIKPLPEVELVMDMDGWGFPTKKKTTYNSVINPEPVQFTGFKLFYKNDVKPPSTRMLTPQEILSLTPAPSFIQYQ
jgi:hypothetical protein